MTYQLDDIFIHHFWFCKCYKIGWVLKGAESKYNRLSVDVQQKCNRQNGTINVIIHFHFKSHTACDSVQNLYKQTQLVFVAIVYWSENGTLTIRLSLYVQVTNFFLFYPYKCFSLVNSMNVNRKFKFQIWFGCCIHSRQTIIIHWYWQQYAIIPELSCSFELNINEFPVNCQWTNQVSILLSFILFFSSILFSFYHVCYWSYVIL